MSYSYLQFCWDTQLFHIIRDYKNHLEIKLFLGTVTLELLLQQGKNGNKMCFWPTKREMATYS